MIKRTRLSATAIILPCAFLFCLAVLLFPGPSDRVPVTAASASKMIPTNETAVTQEPCEIPEDPFLTPLRITQTSMELGWPTPPSMPLNWRIRITKHTLDGAEPPPFYQGEIGLPIAGHEVDHEITGLLPNSFYVFRIRKVCTADSVSEERILIERTNATFCGEPMVGRPSIDNSTGTGSVSWQPAPGARAYLVTLKKGTSVVGFPFRYDSAAGGATFDDLEPSTEYTVCVKTICGIPDTEFNSDEVCQTFPTGPRDPNPPVCPAPGDFRDVETELTATSAKLKWKPLEQVPTGFIGVSYEIEYQRADGSRPAVPLLFLGGNSVPIGPLTPNTEYRATIKTFCQVGRIANGIYSGKLEHFFTTEPCEPPEVPAEVADDDTSYNSARIKWTPAEDTFSGYRWTVRYKNRNPGPGQPTGWLEEISDPGETKLTIGRAPNKPNATPLVPNATYDYEVITNCGATVQSDPQNLKPWFKTDPCPIPTPVGVENRTVTSARLVWTSVADRYDLWLKPKDDDCPDSEDHCWRQINNLTGNEKGVGGLESDTDYIFKVRSHCTFAEPTKFSDPMPFRTLECRTAVPSVSVGNIKKNSALLKWSSVPSAVYYQYQYKRPDDDEWSEWSPPQFGLEQTLVDLDKCQK